MQIVGVEILQVLQTQRLIGGRMRETDGRTDKYANNEKIIVKNDDKSLREIF